MRSSTWFGQRARFTVVFSLTLMLALSTTVAFSASPLVIFTDPFTQATCHASAATNQAQQRTKPALFLFDTPEKGTATNGKQLSNATKRNCSSI